MASTGTVIYGADYNGVQVKAGGILGTGAYYSGPTNGYGYGQSVTSSQVSPTAVITTSQWNALCLDLNKIYYHQNGTNFPNYSTFTSSVNNTSQITYNNLAYLSEAADSGVTNRFSVASGQRTLTTDFATDTPTSDWGASPRDTIVSYRTADFTSVNAMHYFFNAGGAIYIRGTSDGTPANDQETAWQALVGAIGVTINRTTLDSMIAAGTYVTIASGSSSTTPYTGASYLMEARIVSTYFIEVRLYFTDNHLPTGLGPDTITATTVGWAWDLYTPSGSNVSVTAPILSTPVTSFG